MVNNCEKKNSDGQNRKTPKNQEFLTELGQTLLVF